LSATPAAPKPEPKKASLLAVRVAQLVKKYRGIGF
jgi:hypothetical protein